MPAVQDIVVSWCSEASMIQAATARGWTEGESLLDYVEPFDHEERKAEFSSVTKAKAWAVRNRMLDCWREPSIHVYAYPNERRRHWEQETVRSLRYSGGGDGWVDIDL